MRTSLLILTLTGLLAACSDNGGGQPDKSDPDSAQSAESAQTQDQTEPGKKESATPDLEAGQPVTKPTPPEPDSSGDSEEKGQQGSGDKAGQAPKDATETDQSKGDSAKKVAAADIYDRYCVACHEQGMAGAPKLANTAEWQKRLDKRGLKGLASNSWDGYRAMPAKGTCSSCSREELEATVQWMLDQAEVSF